MRVKTTGTEFKSMLRDCAGEVPKLTRVLRNRLRLNQEALGELAGVHRNAITRLESGRSGHLDRWVRVLFFVLLGHRDKDIGKDIATLREHAKKHTPMEPTGENTPLFTEFLRIRESCGESIVALSKEIRRRYELTQEDFAELLCSDRTAVTHLEGSKHKYPERQLTDLYLAFLMLNDRRLMDEVASLGREKVRSGVRKKAEKKASFRPEPKAEKPATVNLPASPVRAVADQGTEESLKKYGFRTRQEFDNALRNQDLTLEKKRQLALIEVELSEELKKKEALKMVRLQLQALKSRILRELYDRGPNDQAVFTRAAQSYAKGRSTAEISLEHGGYLSLPFCVYWEKNGFDINKFLEWNPSGAEVYDIYSSFEPEFKLSSVEYRFRPRKKGPGEQTEIPESSKNLAALLKMWFPQLAADLLD